MRCANKLSANLIFMYKISRKSSHALPEQDTETFAGVIKLRQIFSCIENLPKFYLANAFINASSLSTINDEKDS